MPAPKMPTPPSSTSTAAAIEALARVLTGRPGWKSKDGVWTYSGKGLTVTAHAGAIPFLVTRRDKTSSSLSTTAGLDLHLLSAGA
ncbi:MAG: hypothetical protein JO222_03950 [Frankiales bacterium]|nr:hypothetical protein [Frankiales bacterium]